MFFWGLWLSPLIIVSATCQSIQIVDILIGYVFFLIENQPISNESPPWKYTSGILLWSIVKCFAKFTVVELISWIHNEVKLRFEIYFLQNFCLFLFSEAKFKALEKRWWEIVLCICECVWDQCNVWTNFGLTSFILEKFVLWKWSYIYLIVCKYIVKMNNIYNK